MIIPQKTYTSNPFVDNIIYYAKWLAMNCTVKDEEEALKNETKETLEAGELLISCVEGHAVYELFPYIPKEILEEYIPVTSNLDVYVDPANLRVHLRSYPLNVRTKIVENLSKIAREVYQDHYVITRTYLDSVGPDWLDDNRLLYNMCVTEIADYEDLFDLEPQYTRKRILQTYLNNFDAEKIDEITESLASFKEYIETRHDSQIDSELLNISDALRKVFISHYEHMQNRHYFNEDYQRWLGYKDDLTQFTRCRNGTAVYGELYPMFPEDELKKALNAAINPQDVVKYNLAGDIDALNYYFTDVLSDEMSPKVQEALNAKMREMYLSNYNTYLSENIYQMCEMGTVDYFDLVPHMPPETLKMIINTQIEEFTNLEVYADEKDMLNRYLATLDPQEAQRIKDAITKDMMIWYPLNYVEKNNYYRALIGQPPLDENGNPYHDTLERSYNSETEQYIEFGDRFIKELPTGIYPEIHWKQNLDEFDSYDIGILNERGILDEYIEACGSTPSSPRYKYIRYLADNKLDIYQCRRGLKFQLIGIPTVDDVDAQKRFVDKYVVNREYCIKAVYSDAHKLESDYYDKFMIIFILINTIMDMLADITQQIIDREVFDGRCIQWLFESYGVPYYSEIPLKYLRAMLKNLNILLKYKSSTRNMIDICNLFGFSDVRVFGYYLFRERQKEVGTDHYIFSNDNEIVGYSLDKIWIREPSWIQATGVVPNPDQSVFEYFPHTELLDTYDGKFYGRVGQYYVIIEDNAKFRDENGDEVEEFGDTVTTIRDYNGIKFTRLDKWREFKLDSWTTELSVLNEETGEVTKERVVNNDIDMYILDPIEVIDEEDEEGNPIKTHMEYNFTPFADNDYFTNIQADLRPAELKFFKVPIDEMLTEYKNDPNYTLSYDEITYNDEGDTWDGGIPHQLLYDRLCDHEFNAVKTKYISVETVTDLTEQCFQVSYFYNMLFDNFFSEDALTVKIPFIKIDHEFRFMDVICYLFALMYYYNDLADNIMYSPTQILFVKGYNFDDVMQELLYPGDQYGNNFHNAVDKMLDDPRWFTQPSDPENSRDPYYYRADRDNIFDVNERIAEDGYDYREAFKRYRIRGFNLEADVDALDRWLMDNWQMSLSDFIVDDDLIEFDHIITLKDFFSLNNSVYSKDLFQDHVNALPYNQNLKVAFDVDLLKKVFDKDFDDQTHGFVAEAGRYEEVIDDKAEYIFIMDYITSMRLWTTAQHTILYMYHHNEDGTYSLADHQPYYFNNTTGQIERFFQFKYYIVDKYDRYIFSADKFYKYDPENKEYIEIPDDGSNNYFTADKWEYDHRRLIFGEYWVKNKDGKWELDLSQVYVWVERPDKDGGDAFLPWEEAHAHENPVVSPDDCWVKHSDGHFIRFIDTDYYKNHKEDPEGNIIFDYGEEEVYIEVEGPTDESDTMPDGTVKYFQKLADYYDENNWVFKDELYVKDPVTGEFIPEDQLLNPGNCYYEVGQGQFDLVVNHLASYEAIYNPRDVSHVLILQSDNDYKKFIKHDDVYEPVKTPNKRYVYNSDNNYVTLLYPNATYADTKSMIVVFNRAITAADKQSLEYPEKYNPEKTDNVWDENDWFYEDEEATANEDIGMHGENVWYYWRPGMPRPIVDEKDKEPVGSGFYMEAFAYIGDVELEPGCKYYMAFDVETNFTGYVQIFNTADNSVLEITDSVYLLENQVEKHISQVFIANDNTRPEIRFIIYDFETHAITPGDFIILSNIRFVKANSENFIPQDIDSYDKLQELYKTNAAIYKYLNALMAHETDFHRYGMLKKIFDSLMISKYNKEAFKIGENTYAKTYTEFLENRDAVLYAKLARFKTLDPDTMHKEIADEIIEVTYAIDDCVDTYTYGFLYSYFPAVSANYIQQYITKLINWFKSWKVHLLGINTVYKLGDPDDDNTRVKALEDQFYKNVYRLAGRVHVHDIIKVNPMDDVDPTGKPYTDTYDIDKYTQKIDDNVTVRDRIRVISRTANKIEYHDNELHLVFNNDEIVAGADKKTDDLHIMSNSAGFRAGTTEEPEHSNDLIMSTEESEQAAFAHQVIDEINKTTGEFIDWRDIVDECD